MQYYKDLLEQDELLTDEKVLILHAFFNNFKNQKNILKPASTLLKQYSVQY